MPKNDAKKSVDGRQHHRDAITRHDVLRDQPLRHRGRGLAQVADRSYCAEDDVLVLQHRDVDVVRMVLGVAVEHLGQRA